MTVGLPLVTQGMPLEREHHAQSNNVLSLEVAAALGKRDADMSTTTYGSSRPLSVRPHLVPNSGVREDRVVLFSQRSVWFATKE